MLCLFAVSCYGQEIPRSEIPDDHLAYFGLRGPVQEVREYGFYNYTKTVMRFDHKGRLTEYEEYGNPFAGDGGCVFRLMRRYRYAYDTEGKIMFLETYDEDYALVDAYADMILELFPEKPSSYDAFEKAEREYGDTTYCYSRWFNTDEKLYSGYQYDLQGNWTEHVYAVDSDHADVTVREITYYIASNIK